MIADAGACVSAKKLPNDLRTNLLNRSVRPLLDYRSSRWPPQTQIGLEVDVLQRKLIATAVRLPRRENEPTDCYFRRRGRNAAALARISGTWPKRWFGRATRWDEHLRRARNAESWTARLLGFHDSTWLQTQRRLFSSASVLAGRTFTRAFPGYVAPRWEQGIDLGKAQ